MRVRLEPHDEFTHDPGDEPLYNESMYVNAVDPSSQVGVFVRVGNRPNEGYAEMTVCCYLPDGRVGFMFGRPTISGNDALDAGGLRFEVHEPFEHLSVTYDGEVLLLDDPSVLHDPRAAFTTAPRRRARLELDHRRISAMFGGEAEGAAERPGEEFAKAHYEQLVTGVGQLSIGDESWAIDGAGLRDHSWGKRTWQAMDAYRWLTGNLGTDAGFMVSRIARGGGDGTRGGFVWEDGQLHVCDDASVRTTWEGTQQQHIEAELGAGERRWSITGDVRTVVPLRNRREGRTTRIAEGLTRWTTGDGRTGWGLSEYLDQLDDDGQPAGLPEERADRA